VAYAIAAILLLAWLVGVIFGVGGGSIHALLAAGLAMLAVNLFLSYRRS
jgi:predicted membrane metal-binding protein